ncbi:uncharacterized protein LOC124915577 [Impatiens glandulifera]|uniref:uncharacterized protein LOC124915577 n=1 Tax=Impatiens glandulifera TaxID=253017 RepID=UPI001FB0BEE0|nr:uncharacterized protein LOC124915577 [Impatiens glandulifera]
MGNCLVTEYKIIKVMKTDGKVLEYRAPIKVHQVLSDFSGHAISDKLPVVSHLCLDFDMIVDHLYYLLPLPVLPAEEEEEKEKKRVRFSNPQDIAGQEGSGVVRIKLVITKQELEMMLSRGALSLDDMISHLQDKQNSSNQAELSNKGWKPSLESIPE